MGKPLLGLILITRIRASHGSCNHPDGAFAKKANNSHSSNWLRRAEGSWSKNPFNRLNPWLKTSPCFPCEPCFVLYHLSECFPRAMRGLYYFTQLLRCLTHTGVGISPIQVLVSHPYRCRCLTHTPYGISLIELSANLSAASSLLPPSLRK